MKITREVDLEIPLDEVEEFDYTTDTHLYHTMDITIEVEPDEFQDDELVDELCERVLTSSQMDKIHEAFFDDEPELYIREDDVLIQPDTMVDKMKAEVF